MPCAFRLSQKGWVTGSGFGSGLLGALMIARYSFYRPHPLTPSPVIGRGGTHGDGTSSLRSAEDGGTGRREDAAGAVDDRQLAVRHLPDPLIGVVVAQLPDTLDDGEHPVHTRMVVGETAAVGIHREGAARRGALAADEVAALALLAKAQLFQRQQHGVGEGVVDHRQIEIL